MFGFKISFLLQILSFYVLGECQSSLEHYGKIMSYTDSVLSMAKVNFILSVLFVLAR